MTTLQEQHKRTVRKYPRAVAAGNLDVIDEICTEDVVSHAPLGEPRGREALKEYEAPVHEAFPNFDATFEDIVAEDDRVAMRLTIRGTHEGEMMGIPPTENHVEFQTRSSTGWRTGRSPNAGSSPTCSACSSSSARSTIRSPDSSSSPTRASPSKAV